MVRNCKLLPQTSRRVLSKSLSLKSKLCSGGLSSETSVVVVVVVVAAAAAAAAAAVAAAGWPGTGLTSTALAVMFPWATPSFCFQLQPKEGAHVS